MDVLAQPSDLRRMFLRSFGRESFAVVGPLALTGAPHIRRAPFLLLKDALPVRRLASSLPASFSADLAVVPACRLAVRVGRCDQLPRGLPPPIQCPMLGTPTKSPLASSREGLAIQSCGGWI